MRRSILRWAVALAALTPAGVMASDQDTAQEIAAALRGSGRLVDYSIGVKYENGTAWLLGRVASDEQAREAISMTEQLPMVTRVVNNLDIKATRPAAVPDVAEQETIESPAPQETRNPVSAFLSGKRVSTSRPEKPADPLEQHSDLSKLTPPAEPPRGEQAAASRMSRWQEAIKSSLGFGGTKAPAADHEGQLTAFVDAEPAVAKTTPAPVKAAPAPVAPVQNVKPAAAPAPAAQPPLAQQPIQATHAVNTRPVVAAPARRGPPVPVGGVAPASYNGPGMTMPIQGAQGGPTPAMAAGYNTPAYDQPHLPNHAWPSYAAYPNYAAVTYPKQYSPTAWPYIGPFYPYPQVPLGWRKVTLEWDDGWWFLDFSNRRERRRH